MALDRAIMKVEAEAVLTSSNWIAANDQGPVIKAPAPAANENDALPGALRKHWTALNRPNSLKKVPRDFNTWLTSLLDRAGPSLLQSDGDRPGWHTELLHRASSKAGGR